MENMKKGLGTGGLLLAVLACVVELRAEDVQWQAVSAAPRAEPAAVALDAPVPIPAHAVTQATPVDPKPGGILPASFETAIPVMEPPSHHPTQQIIAVSAPVQGPAAPPAEEQDETSETVFAADRPFPSAVPARAANGGIVRTSAGITVPVDHATSGVPMIPGWDAPADASWGVGVPTVPFPQEAPAAPTSPFNPLRTRLYASGEYLLWWVQGQSVPVLATTSAPSDFGILGAPTTQVLFGGTQINGNSPFSGGRFTAGYWLDCNQSKALEITGFFLGTRSAGFSTNSSVNPVIGRPFFEANNGQESAQLTSLPGVSTGVLTINAPTSLWGLAGNLRCLLCCGCNYRITVLAGFRNINLDESLTITENVVGLPTAPPPFTNQLITVRDSFSTQNHFYGGNLGADARWYWGRWSVDARAQVALGDTVQLLDISGTQHFIPGVPMATGVTQNFTGGLLALPSNIGHFSHNAFSVVPEVGVNLGYQILPYLRGYIGYNFLYWSNVIRPGTSIDRVLDVTQIPNFPLSPEPAPLPGRHPAPVFHEVGLWAQGLTFGLEFTY
jgi:hypothetical protein